MSKQQTTDWIETDKVLPPDHRIVEREACAGCGGSKCGMDAARIYGSGRVWRRADTGEITIRPDRWRYCT